MHHRDRSRGARVMISLDSAVSTVAAADAHAIESENTLSIREKTLSIRQERKHE